MKYIAIRDIPVSDQCSGRVIKKGEILYPVTLPTYGCIEKGIGVGFTENEYPFFEIINIERNLEEIP